MHTQKRPPSDIKHCPICLKKVRARGYTSHLRLAHPNHPKLEYGIDNQTKVEFLDEDLKRSPEVSSIGSIYRRKKPTKKKYTEQTIGELIAMFGLAWVLFKAYEYVNKNGTLKSEPNKPTHRYTTNVIQK